MRPFVDACRLARVVADLESEFPCAIFRGVARHGLAESVAV